MLLMNNIDLVKKKIEFEFEFELYESELIGLEFEFGVEYEGKFEF